MAASAYSVLSAPRVVFHSGLPKPMENLSTFTPSRRANQKWPKSWIAIKNPSAIRKMNNEEKTLLITVLSAYRCDMFLRPPSGAVVFRQDHFLRHRVALSQWRV